MHLTKDELVATLREECSFLPSPGASLNQFASGTAKHLLNLTDPVDKTEPVNYREVKGAYCLPYSLTLPFSSEIGRNRAIIQSRSRV